MCKFRKVVSIILLLVILMFVCTACNGKNVNFLAKTPDLNKQYATKMSVQAGELEFSCTVKRFGTEFWEMNVDSPDTLAGMTVAMNSEGVKATLDELVLDIPMEDVRDKAVFALIFKALDNAAANKLSCTDTEDGMYYEGEFGGVVYHLTFDSESLKPVLLEIPEAALTAEIKGFETLDEMEEKETLTQTTAETD
ncbi:MAG: hypothetical protein J6K17_12520 [Oscillospiraceae bacterium]|nr:hypothetical protein [Oscillospiraceae bacterium]